MKPNRYIKAMEIGLANEEKGISYFDLVKELEKQPNSKFGKESELTFLVWFSQNFRRSDKDLTRGDVENYRWHLKLRDGEDLSDVQKRTANNIESKLKFKYWLNGEAAKQYLDYQELVESRKASTQAKKQSNISIILAILAIIISTVLGYSTQDVKIVEDGTRTLQLERENSQLKDELYKAEMMLEVYEKD